MCFENPKFQQVGQTLVRKKQVGYGGCDRITVFSLILDSFHQNHDMFSFNRSGFVLDSGSFPVDAPFRLQKIQLLDNISDTNDQMKQMQSTNARWWFQTFLCPPLLAEMIQFH